MFLVPVSNFSQSRSDLINGFNHDLVYANNIEPFGTNGALKLGLLCYPCLPSKNVAVHIRVSDFRQILLTSQFTNGNMRKQILLVQNRYMVRDYTKCLQLPSPFVDKETYNSFPCAPLEIAWSTFGHAINATFVSSVFKRSEIEVMFGNWITNVALFWVYPFQLTGELMSEVN